MIKIPVNVAQKHVTEISTQLFALEAIVGTDVTKPLHDALASGQSALMKHTEEGAIQPLDGGGGKPPPPAN